MRGTCGGSGLIECYGKGMPGEAGAAPGFVSNVASLSQRVLQVLVRR